MDRRIDFGELRKIVTEVTDEKAIADFVASVTEDALKLRLALLRDATSRKMMSYQASGRRMSRFLPYGWQSDKNNPKLMIPNPEERKTIDRILELHEQGFGFRPICRKLTEEGYKPRKQKKKFEGRTVEVDGNWNHVTVQKIIAREASEKK